MKKSDIIKEVAEGTGLTKVEIEAVLEGVILSISDSLKRGERVDIRGFGSFIIKQRAARDARNPATREIVKLQERFIPAFKVSKILKEIVNNCEHEWIRERESGQYGELYTFCSKCRVDKSLSFIHR